MVIRISGSFRRYLLEGFRPARDDAKLYEQVLEQRFRSIDEQPAPEPSVGWVRSGSFSSTDFRPETVCFGPVILLRMRIDRKRLPTNAVKVRLQEALGEMGGKVARSARDSLRQEIEKELLARTVPTTAVFEVYWRPDEEVLLLSSTAAAAHDSFTSLFRRTFGVTPQAATPGPMALRVAAPQVTAERLERVTEFQLGVGS